MPPVMLRSRGRGESLGSGIAITGDCTVLGNKTRTRSDEFKAAEEPPVYRVRVLWWPTWYVPQIQALWWRCWRARWRRRRLSLHCSLCSTCDVSSHRSDHTSLLTQNHTAQSSLVTWNADRKSLIQELFHWRDKTVFEKRSAARLKKRKLRLNVAVKTYYWCTHL